MPARDQGRGMVAAQSDRCCMHGRCATQLAGQGLLAPSSALKCQYQYHIRSTTHPLQHIWPGQIPKPWPDMLEHHGATISTMVLKRNNGPTCWLVGWMGGGGPTHQAPRGGPPILTPTCPPALPCLTSRLPRLPGFLEKQPHPCWPN